MSNDSDSELASEIPESVEKPESSHKSEGSELPEGSEVPESSEKRLWYVLKVQSNREKSIRDALLRGIKRDGLEEYFGEIIIPTEKVVETKGG
ncbi:MAG: transcription termination/antitermination NusG family protein, partial [Planctomycetota bacterium]